MHGSVGSWTAEARPEVTGRDRQALVSAPSITAPADEQGCPELDCVRDLLPADVLAAAATRAERIGFSADRVLITQGHIDEEIYLRRLAAAIGTTFEPLDAIGRAQCPLDDAKLSEAYATGMLPLVLDGTLRLVIAPRVTATRRLIELTAENKDWRDRFRFTSAAQLQRYILHHAGGALTERARDRLKDSAPDFSAAVPCHRARWRARAGLACLVACAFLASAPTALVMQLALALLFMAWLALRLAATIIARPSPASPVQMTDTELPIYTVIAALHREADFVDGLLRALERLDYPREKLDVILAVEADDQETRAAIDKRQHRFPITVVSVPKGEPRTKPKALNVALPFARGTFTVIYDAEDRPEPDQLRRALDVFRAHGEDLACVQARLCIDNTADSWITRLFTAEYAGQFDVFLNGLARLRLPLPLGGSSNHFYTDVLRKVGAWDPYNVTEDAELGMRLARHGYRTAMISSTTYEEAPARFGPWLRQRTRWFKGWMQTWCVHMRAPFRLWHDLGPAGFFALQLVVGGNVLAALVHPLFLIGLAMLATEGWPKEAWHESSAAALIALYGATALSGYLTSALIGWLGLKRRGLLATAWILLLTPLNWIMLSVAAWRALLQLITAPYQWEKTDHGLARTSRQADNLARSLVEVEECLRRLKQSADLPRLARERPSLFARSRNSTPRRAPAARFTRHGRGSMTAIDRG